MSKPTQHTMRVLYYISMYGTTRGITDAMAGEADPAMAISSLRRRGLVERIGRQKYLVTDEGWDVLRDVEADQEFSSFIPSMSLEELRTARDQLVEKVEKREAQYLADREVDVEGVSSLERGRLVSAVHRLGDTPLHYEDREHWNDIRRLSRWNHRLLEEQMLDDLGLI